MGRRVVHVLGAAEAEGRLAKQSGGPGLYAVVRLRLLPGEGERPRVLVESALGPNDPVAEYLPGVVRGVGRAAYEASLFGARVVVVGGRTHEVDSSSTAFAHAARSALHEALRAAPTRAGEVDEALYPRVRGVSGGARLVTEGIDVEIVPEAEALDERPAWATRWASFDPRLEPVMRAEIERLAGASPPWVDLRVVLRGGVEAGQGASAGALRCAINAALAAARPLERPKAGPEVVRLG
ncbi:MAG TPA: hypothetical protein VFS00_34825 [Polyangiaceae bacterium]|nr:hypothetical protein [Polyangiaceae bacterium]